jgi:hypothetical protein
MNRQEFEHVIRACANATAGNEFLIIGSQSILGSVPNAPRELRVSMELDICPLAIHLIGCSDNQQFQLFEGRPVN